MTRSTDVFGQQDTSKRAVYRASWETAVVNACVLCVRFSFWHAWSVAFDSLYSFPHLEYTQSVGAVFTKCFSKKSSYLIPIITAEHAFRWPNPPDRASAPYHLVATVMKWSTVRLHASTSRLKQLQSKM